MSGEVRAEAPTSAKVLTGKDRDPARYKAELARLEAIKMFMDRSGNLAITTAQHQKLRGFYGACNDAGYDCSGIVDMLDEIARQSPDTRGISRKEVVQLLEEKNVLLPGAGVIGPEEKPKGGIIAWIKSWFGKKEEEA